MSSSVQLSIDSISHTVTFLPALLEKEKTKETIYWHSRIIQSSLTLEAVLLTADSVWIKFHRNLLKPLVCQVVM